MKRLNVKVLVILFALIVFGTAGAFAAWYAQWNKQTARFLSDARAGAEILKTRKFEDPEEFTKVFKDAQTNYTKYLGRNPDDKEILRERTFFLVDNGFYDSETVKLLKKFYEENPEDLDCLRKLAVGPFRLKEYAEALRYIDKVLEKSPEDVLFAVMRVRSLEFLSRQSEIVPWLTKNIKDYPQNLTFYSLLASYYQSLGRRDVLKYALQTMNEMVRNNQDVGEAYLRRAMYFLDLDQTQESIRAQVRSDLKRAYELEPKNAVVLMRYAEVLAGDNDLDQAKALAEQAIALDTTQETPYRVLATVLIASGDQEGGLATLEKGLGQATEKDRLLEMKIRASLKMGNVANARDAEKQIRDSGRNDWLVNYLSALIDLTEKKPDDAIAKLQQARNMTPKENRRILRDVTMALCAAYASTNDTAHAMTTLSETLQKDGSWYGGQVMLAELQASTNQFRTAAGTMIGALKLPDADPAQYENVLYWLLQNELSQNVRLRDWQQFNQTLETAKQMLPNSERVKLLEAWGYTLQGEMVLASKTMSELSPEVTSHLSQQAIQVLLIETALRQNDLVTAEKKLAEFSEDPANATLSKSLTARLWIQKKDPDAVPKMLELLKNLDQIPEKEQYDFALQMLKMLWAMGHSAEALEASKIVVAKWPDSLDVQLGIFDTAIQMDDLDTAKAAKEAIQKLDKEGLFAMLADGITSLAMGEKERDLAKRDELYAQASLRFSQVLEKRDNWGWAWFLKGKLFIIQEKYSEAISAFEKAIAHGESNPALYENTLMVLNQKEYVSETQTLLKALSEKNSGEENDRFRRVSALLAIRQLRFAEALKTADEVYTKLDPNSTESNVNYSWLAIVYSSGVAQNIRESKTETAEYQTLVRKAEDCFKRAMQSPSVPIDLRLEQFRFMILIGQKDRIPALLEEDAKTMVDSSAMELRANASLLLNDLDGANAAFGKLLQAEPYNLSYMQQAARFYLDTGRNEELIALARTHLDNQDAPAPVKRWARQNFAIAAIVLNRTDPLLREEAKKLIEANITESKEPSRLDLRLKAELYTADGQLASRKIALDIMTNLVKNFRPSILDEEILYGKLLMLSGDKPSTTRHFDELRKRYPGSIDVMTAYISILLAYQDYPYARALIDNLLEQMPDSNQGVQFRLDRFFALNEYNSIVSETRKQLDRIKRSNGNYVGACIAFGKLLLNYYRQPVAAGNQEALGVLATESESCFRLALQADPKCAAAIPLASLLIRQGRIDDALKLVSERSATGTDADCSMFMVDAGVQAMSFTPEQSAIMETFIQETMTRFGRTFSTLGGLAEYRICQNRIDEAEKVYQEGVVTSPNSIVTLNNLAYLWAIQKKNPEEAMKLVDRAVFYYGEQLQLRDTRAMIYLAMKQPDKAIADLTPQPNEKPTVVNLFHLAEAQWMAGDQQTAKITFDDAKQQGLVPSLLRTVELEMYQQLDSQL